MNKRYPGIGIIGNEKLSGIYGMNEGIIDAKGTGIQHLFYRTFDVDLVHSACTLVKIGNTLYYGNRKETKEAHQNHMKPVSSDILDGFLMTDVFEDEIIRKSDRACGFGENKLAFDFELTNLKEEMMDIEIYTYLILRNVKPIDAKIIGNKVVARVGDTVIGVKATHSEGAYLVAESPTGFLYRTTNAIFYDEKTAEDIQTDNMLGVLIGGKQRLNPQETTHFKWGMVFDQNEDALYDELDAYDVENYAQKAHDYWNSYLEEGYPCPSKEHADIVKINQIAIKSAMVDGFVPADLTGHYFSDGLPSYYARDSLMIARAFLLSGHIREFKEVVNYLFERKRKGSGEFYQRYNGKGEPSEGSNNSVFHQLDSIGYFMKNIRDYYKLTGEQLIEEEDIKTLMQALLDCEKKNGMIGPEGGVNEGVYGPAYITSSNMFIYGGVKSSMELIQDAAFNDGLAKLNRGILEGIESTYLEGEGYMYGYVTYHDDLVKKYDTPVYFGVPYGFENTENMKRTHGYLVKNAAFFGDGIGYSEQEYHHGPWLFNTAACAEYAYLSDDLEEYNKKIKWLSEHCNQYGLMPEAVSADDENLAYINPLIWACAEFVSASFISYQQKA